MSCVGIFRLMFEITFKNVAPMSNSMKSVHY